MGFEITKSNFIAYKLDDKCPPRFVPWVRFLTTQSMVSHALTAHIQLDAEMLQDLWTTAQVTNSEEEMALHCTIKNQPIKITDDDVNRILEFPRDQLVNSPSFDRIKNFLRDTCGYNEVITGNAQTILQKNFIAQWSYFGITLSKCFLPRPDATHRFSLIIQKVAFAVANNLRINIGRLILQELAQRLGASEKRSAKIIYPRFLMLFLKDKLQLETFTEFTGPKQEPQRSKLRSVTALDTKWDELPVRLTAYMNQVMEFQNHPSSVPIQGPILIPEELPRVLETINQIQASVAVPSVVPVSVTLNQVGETINHASMAAVPETLNTVRDTITSATVAHPPMDDSFPSHQVDNLPPVTQAQTTNTIQTLLTKLKITRSKSIASAANRKRLKGVTASGTANKDGSVSVPSALPVSKKAKYTLQVTESPSESSQKDLELQMAMNLSLGLTSQQVGSIEFDPSTRVFETECHTTETINTSNAHVSDAHTSVNSDMPDSVTDAQGGFRVIIGSNISSPDLMDLDLTQRGNSVAGTDSELVGDDTTPVVEPNEELRSSEEKQNNKSGEGEMSGKESKSMGLEARDKKSERLRENPLPKLPSIISVRIPDNDLFPDIQNKWSDKEDFRSDKDEMKQELADVKDDMRNLNENIKTILTQLNKIAHNQGSAVTAAQALRLDLSHDMKENLGKMEEKLGKLELKIGKVEERMEIVNGSIFGLNQTNARLSQLVQDVEAQSITHTTRLNYVTEGLERVHNIHLPFQQAQLTYVKDGVMAIARQLGITPPLPPNTNIPPPNNDKRDPPPEYYSTKGESYRGNKGDGDAGTGSGAGDDKDGTEGEQEDGEIRGNEAMDGDAEYILC